MKLKRPLDYHTEKHLRHMIFAGRLANDVDIFATPISEPVKYENEYDEGLIFFVKCLSPIPEALQEFFMFQNAIFNGLTRWGNNMEQILRIDPSIERAHPVDKLAKLKKVLQDKLLLFQLVQPRIFGHREDVYLQLELIRIEDVKPGKGYVSIPSPKLNRNREEFEFALRNGRPITLAYYPSILSKPELIYYDGYIYGSKDGNMHYKSSPEEPVLYYAENPEVLVRLETEEFKDMVQTSYDHQLFFLSVEEQQKLMELKKRLAEEGEPLSALPDVSKQAPLLQPMTAKEITESAEASATVLAVSEKMEDTFSVDELAFIQRFEKNAFLQGLYYDREDLVNFHVCMKSNLLTIIGGMSGTGKSQLAQVYAQTLGMTFQQEVLFIPISPSYREPVDVLGFLNPSTGVYHESETGLVSLLLEAETNPDKLYMVIFDEMNLSQVEHWFSPFISVLELDEDRRWLTLYPQRDHCVNERYRPTVKIGKNVLFVGTVNLDETTKGFSNRLLDRANVVFPKKMSFYEAKKQMAKHEVETPKKSENIVVSTADYRGRWCRDVEPFGVLFDHELQFLDRLHELLNQTDSQRGISFRMVRGIANFLANIPADENGKPLLSRERAWDLQIQQRVLTKVRGMEAAISPLVGIYQGDTYQEGQLARLLKTEGKAVSSFAVSLATIQRKARELAVHGYAE